MPSRETKNPNSRLPLFTEAMLAYGPNIIPTDGSIPPDTYLSGLEGIPVARLNQKQAEKFISLSLGFEQTPEFTRIERGIVRTDNQNIHRIFLYDDIRKAYFPAEPAMEKILAQGKDMIGLRVVKAYDQNAPIVPFAWFSNLTDRCLIRSRKNGPIIGLKFKKPNNGKEYYRYHFKPNDRIELFSDPMSVSTELDNPRSEKKENIHLGGGFSFQLHEFNPGTETMTALVDITFNNRNIRLFGKPEIIPKEGETYKNDALFPHQFSFTLDLKRNPQDGGLYLVDPHQSTKTIDELKTKGILNYLREVAESFVIKNPLALAKMAKNTLSLQPKFDAHSVKCMYATVHDENGDLKIVTQAFDLESAVHSEEQWKNTDQKYKDDKTIHYSYLDLQNPRLIETINSHHARWQEPSGTMRYITSLLIKAGITDETMKASADVLQVMKEIKEPIQNLHELISQYEKTVSDSTRQKSNHRLQKRSGKLQAYTNNIPHEFLRLTKDVSTDYPPARMLGEIMATAYPQFKDNPDWSTINIFENPSGAINIITRRNNPQDYFITLDAESRLQFCVPVINQRIPSEFLESYKTRYDSIQTIKKILEEWNLPALPEVYYSNAHEHD